MSEFLQLLDRTRVHFLSRLPSSKKIKALTDKTSFSKALVICDNKLKSHLFLKNWLKDPVFSFYFVPSGETSKSIEKLRSHLKKILNLCQNCGKDQLVFISLGGGSLGDLTGFLASIYKRGVPLIHVPTTWLAALDSAHGGKNALNVSGIKNVVGTYHFPQAVFIVDEILKHLPLKQKHIAFGELLKIALIEGGAFYKSLIKNQLYRSGLKFSLRPSFPRKRESSNPAQNSNQIDIDDTHWKKFLKKGIASKIKIVRQDPFERKSLRKVLNFGHTVGHILEAAWKIPHGQAVMEGIFFSIKWSAQKKLLSKNNLQNLQALIPNSFSTKRQISSSLFKKLLRQDKKYKNSSCIEFVFIQGPGAVAIKKVTEREILQEAQRQGLVKKNVK